METLKTASTDLTSGVGHLTIGALVFFPSLFIFYNTATLIISSRIRS